MADSYMHTKQFALTLTRWVGSPLSVVVHTFVFVGSFSLSFFGVVDWERMLLLVTTVVSLEAIYLAIFIQMSLNFANETIEAVGEDLDEIQKDVDEIQKDVDEIQEDIDDLEEADEADSERRSAQRATLEEIKAGLSKLLLDVEKIR